MEAPRWNLAEASIGARSERDTQAPAILVIDDDALFVAMIRDALEQHYTVLDASNGGEGLAVLARSQVDIVLCDLIMPGTDGVDVLTRSAEIRPDALRILVSSSGTHDSALRAINEARVHAYVCKPLDLDSFRDLLGKLRDERDRLIQGERLAAVGELIAGVTHELNNPLTAVVGFTELLMLEERDEAKRADLENIHSSGKRAGRIVKNLAAFARPSRSSSEVVDLNAMIKAAVNVLKNDLATRDITLKLELDPTLPTCTGDPAALRQVLLALLGRAEAACTARASDCQIRLGTRTHKGRVELFVEDQADAAGSPIEADLFSAASPIQQHGLALAVVQTVVAAHGGEITVRSMPGGGTAYCVILPPTAADGDSASSPRQGQSFAGHRALIVDDELPVRGFLERALVHFGFDVRTHASSTEALAELQRGFEPDIVLCDIRMPGLDGPGLLEIVRDQFPQLAERFLFMTGDAVDEDVRVFLERVALPTLEKPFSAVDLSKAVSEFLPAGE